jgi:hypothetical protein
MPDIDTDFDDQGRQKVIDYVVQKYGQNQVAQIVTYGTMAAKSSIKDVARVLDLDLSISNYLTKLVPDKPGIKLNGFSQRRLQPKTPQKMAKSHWRKRRIFGLKIWIISVKSGIYITFQALMHQFSCKNKYLSWPRSLKARCVAQAFMPRE